MKIRRPLLASLLFVSFALYLRGAKGSVVREWVTSLLGYEWRAVSEHALSGLGFPLMLALLLLGALRNLGKSPSSNKAQLIMLASFFVMFAAFYAVGSYLFEEEQANVSVYGKAARGYFQYSQWYADLTGLAMASCYMLWELAVNRRQPNDLLKPGPFRSQA